MRGVDAALQCLQPVAFLDDLADMAAFCRNLRPGKFGCGRHLVGRAEIGPDEAAELDRRIGGDVDVLFELVLRRLVELVEAMAFDVELPAVIDAPETAFLVASEEQGHPAMRAEFVDQADPAITVAERDEILAEQFDADRRTVRLGDLRRQAGGDPIPPHRLSHRRPGADAGDQFVFLRWQHRRFLLAGSLAGPARQQPAPPLAAKCTPLGRLCNRRDSRHPPQMCNPCPKPTSAASPTASPRVGWTWIVCARSSSAAPIASAWANSPASSATPRPTAWMPRMRWS